ncbi:MULTISPECIES: sugar transferase [unclassified Sphingomonas]|uniref:sugar transferase n=1 Tax=unclassified Sphingomonas TaxID=196159 RepID=UPI001D11B312|nr:sugar transferase [Sphingomonas sp. IC4-52]MCC2981670.1 sugar transferase [Sphingomonas sp. IC4-52]MCD2317575.1 sugar transferase [Sphingomonas sp. IC-11]
MGNLQLRHASHWESFWFQVGGGILIAGVLPYLTRMALGLPPNDYAIHLYTLIGVVAATVVAIWLTRHIATYPGQEAASSLLPSFGLAYGTLLGIFILSRIQYNRVSLVAGLVFGFIWMLFVLTTSQRRRLRIGLIPIGNIQTLMEIENVDWHLLHSPDEPIDGIDAVAVDLRGDLPDAWETRLADYALAQLPVLHSKHLMESLTGRVELEHLSENSFGSLTPRPAYRVVKHAIDWIAAAVLGILLLPLMLLIALLVKVTSAGPALFVQERIGSRGQPFRVYKFRTMTAAVDPTRDVREAAITQSGDSRITPLGRFLRKSRLDELPQLFNVLKGEMSFIGPRPEAAVLSRWYEQEIPFYRYRHIIRPGIAGWAQVCQGHVAEVDEVRNKLHYDFYYIKHYSPWIDMLIVVKTIRTMITGHGSK